jgi:3-phenylpropionate/trans-cinnamate dioxygenase ferredoxin reductase component
MAVLESVVIVGASLAGIRAATTLRRQKFAGRVTLIGAEHHLPYDRPPLSKQILLGAWPPEKAALVKPEEVAKLDLDLRLGVRATALDTTARTVTLGDGTAVSYGALIIATGATPRTLPGTPPLAGVHVLRTMEDSLAIRAAFEEGARVGVVGAGFIGAEVAAAARMRGLSVTMVEPLAQPMERALGPVVGAVAARIHREHGVDLRLGIGVTAIEGQGRVERVILSDGSHVAADLVVVGIGVRPETAWLESSGLALRDGVLCDQYLQASAAGVFAAGDVCRWSSPLYEQEMRIEHWTSAAEQGMTAARNILAAPGEMKPYAAVPYVWSDQYDLSIQYIGHASGEDEVLLKHGSFESGEFVALFGRNGRLMAAVGFNMPRLLNEYRRFIAEKATLAAAMAHIPELED